MSSIPPTSMVFRKRKLKLISVSPSTSESEDEGLENPKLIGAQKHEAFAPYSEEGLEASKAVSRFEVTKQTQESATDSNTQPLNSTNLSLTMEQEGLDPTPDDYDISILTQLDVSTIDNEHELARLEESTHAAYKDLLASEPTFINSSMEGWLKNNLELHKYKDLLGTAGSLSTDRLTAIIAPKFLF